MTIIRKRNHIYETHYTLQCLLHCLKTSNATAAGALAGSVVSLIFMGWITIGTLTAIIEKKIKPVTLPLRVDGCPAGVNVTQTPQIVAKDDSVFPLYKISFAYYTMLGMLIMLVVGTIVSLLTEAPNKEQTNLIYFAPFVRKILNKQRANQTSKEVQRLVQEMIGNRNMTNVSDNVGTGCGRARQKAAPSIFGIHVAPTGDGNVIKMTTR
ncbi:hypothetical protein ANN_15535 [Periplaneta americana]|uniref:Uncharacterized protein n=1 Tax=Periplaneta americana TaxID=6978 RepID=A0ABQ8SHH3_PERAM|nr:hypothetical protein ANN_15535 [Periplaneta americana]